jgi:hypothetical protein
MLQETVVTNDPSTWNIPLSNWISLDINHATVKSRVTGLFREYLPYTLKETFQLLPRLVRGYKLYTHIHTIYIYNIYIYISLSLFTHTHIYLYIYRDMRT